MKYLLKYLRMQISQVEVLLTDRPREPIPRCLEIAPIVTHPKIII